MGPLLGVSEKAVGAWEGGLPYPGGPSTSGTCWRSTWSATRWRPGASAYPFIPK
jgi:hypothetical protein